MYCTVFLSYWAHHTYDHIYLYRYLNLITFTKNNLWQKKSEIAIFSPLHLNAKWMFYLRTFSCNSLHIVNIDHIVKHVLWIYLSIIWKQVFSSSWFSKHVKWMSFSNITSIVVRPYFTSMIQCTILSILDPRRENFVLLSIDFLFQKKPFASQFFLCNIKYSTKVQIQKLIENGNLFTI